MRRRWAMLALPLVLATFVVTAASGAEGENIKPKCADVISGGGILVAESGGGYSLDFGMELAAPSCRFPGYTLVLLENADPGAAVLTSVTKKGDGSSTATGTGELGFFIPNADDDNLACLYVTTGTGRSFDRAPDTGCFDVSESSPGGKPFH